MFKRFLLYLNGKTRSAEILRFLIVGGLATVVDFFMMGITLYLFDRSLYPHFYNIFYGGGEPTTTAKLVGTGVGFIFGLIANYVLSIVFVFNEKGKSKTVKGFIVFTVFSAIGLLIHELGMYLLSAKLGMNEWIAKIILTIVVLVYNYISRKLLIFKKEKDENEVERDSSVL